MKVYSVEVSWRDEPTHMGVYSTLANAKERVKSVLETDNELTAEVCEESVDVYSAVAPIVYSAFYNGDKFVEVEHAHNLAEQNLHKCRIVVKKDCSGKSWEYEMFIDGGHLMMGDGYHTRKDIADWLKDLQLCLNSVDLSIL